VTDPDLFSPYEASLKIMQAVMLNCGDRFEWKDPPYEYEYEKLPIDLILGDPQIRRSVEKAEPIEEIAESWRKDTEEFRRISRSIYLYS
jgi:uncharacterized protein YbbC (DUF1343 family)